MDPYTRKLEQENFVLKAELEQYKKALGLACEMISEYALPSGTNDMRQKLAIYRRDHFLSQAKAGDSNG